MKDKDHQKGGKNHNALMVLVLIITMALSLAVWYYFQQQINHIQALPLSMPMMQRIASAPGSHFLPIKKIKINE